MQPYVESSIEKEKEVENNQSFILIVFLFNSFNFIKSHIFSSNFCLGFLLFCYFINIFILFYLTDLILLFIKLLLSSLNITK